MSPAANLASAFTPFCLLAPQKGINMHARAASRLLALPGYSQHRMFQVSDAESLLDYKVLLESMKLTTQECVHHSFYNLQFVSI